MLKLKVGRMSWTLVLMAVLLLMPGFAQAEMYIEGYLGGVGASNLGDSTTWNYPTLGGFHDNFGVSGKVDAAVIGGGKFGTWFVPTGFLGYDYPEWMKYFGFYTDVSFHRLNVRSERTSATDVVGGTPVFTFPVDFKTDGTVVTWAFMFAARYGFLPDSQVPFGRLQPYVAVGPAIMFSSQQPSIKFPTIGGGINVGSQGSTNVTLAVDAGIRYMCLKNVSIDLSFKYRMANPSYTFTGTDTNIGAPVNFRYEPTYNLFSGQVGVAYHF